MRGVGLVVVLSAALAHASSPHGAAGQRHAVASGTASSPLALHKKKRRIGLTPEVPAHRPEPTEYTNDPIVGLAKRVSGVESPGVIAFTFDDGPNPDTTPAVLEALQRYDIPATFFIVTKRLAGKHGEKGRELLAREMADGHMIASHTVSHRWLGKADAPLLDREMTASFKALSTAAKRPIGMFRAPYGALNAAGRTRLKKLGVTEIFWSIDTLDWKAKDAVKLRKNVARMIDKHNGGVILFHDIRPITAETIASILDDLEARNCLALAQKREPIWPVTLHYFLKDGKASRGIPEDVAQRTEAYKAALPGRCAKRPPPPAPAAPPTPSVAKSASTPGK